VDNSLTNAPGTTGTPVMDQAREQVQRAADTTREAAGRAVDQAREQVMSQLSSQKDRAAGTLGGVAQAIRSTGEQLQGGEQAFVADYAMKAADMIDGFTQQIREREVDELIDQVENFARREPALLIGSAFAIGFMASRFLKSSTANITYTRNSTDRDYQGGIRRESYEELRSGLPRRRAEYATGYPADNMTPGWSAGDDDAYDDADAADLTYAGGSGTGTSTYGRSSAT
jgi:hypothetical protein